MPAGSTFSVKGVKQDSTVVTVNNFSSQIDAQQYGDDQMASGNWVRYTVIEHTPGGGTIEYDND